jgi:hypothetical protein
MLMCAVALNEMMKRMFEARLFEKIWTQQDVIFLTNKG